MVVSDKMAALGSGAGKTQTEYHIVKAPFKHAQKIGTSDTCLTVSLGKNNSELFLRNAIYSSDLLFFP